MPVAVERALAAAQVEGWGAPDLWTPTAPPSQSTEFSRTSLSSQIPIISLISPPDRSGAAR